MPYLMPNGKWRAKRMINGKIRTKVFPAGRKNGPEWKAAIAWESEQTEDRWVEESQTPSTCLLELTNAYLEMSKGRHDKKTFLEKKRAFKYLFNQGKVAPETAPEELTPTMALEALSNVFKAKKSGSIVNKARKNLAAAWAWGKKYFNLPAVNPFLEVERFPEDKNPRYVPPEEDFWKAYDAASLQDQIYLLTLLHTACRRGESFRLLWTDVDFDNKLIQYGSKKNRQSSMEYHWVPMTDELYGKLRKHKAQSVSEYVFTNPANGEPYRSRQHYMGRLCRRAGVKSFGFHAIRHLAATILAHEGLDVPDVQQVLRHKSPNTTSRYIHSLGIRTDKVDQAFRRRGKPRPTEPTPTPPVEPREFVRPAAVQSQVSPQPVEAGIAERKVEDVIVRRKVIPFQLKKTGTEG